MIKFNMRQFGGESKKWAEGIANLISNQKGSVENVNKLIFLEM